MMRMLALLARRPDVTRYAFRNHYEDLHVPLAEPLLEDAIHYVRNHVQAAVAGPPIGFDALSEFGYPGAVEFARLGARLDSQAGQAVRQDELRFMDKSRNVFFELTPRGSGPAARIADGPQKKFAWLVGRDRDCDREAMLAASDRALAGLVSDGMTVLSFECAARAPFDAVAFIWPGDRPAGLARLEVPGAVLTILRLDERVSRREPGWGTR